MRWFNMRPEATHLQLRMNGAFYESDVLEGKGKELPTLSIDGQLTKVVEPCQIVTIGVQQ
ncbi:glycosyl hydrolase-related protein [Paenibacillus phytohabitans]|uniref:glycosyl hydrolase-related protein n=1 Tax=Paenibacillus phytohabitans TaxID=2654978 RepID=UPI0030096E64